METPLPRLLEPFRRHIEATLAPSLCLSSTAAPGGLSASRLGGVPLVPWGMAWPHSPNGPMTFIGQLNLGQLAAQLPMDAGLPRRGTLGLFYDVEEQPWGFDPADSQYWRVVYVPDPSQAVALVPPAPVRDALAPCALSAAPAVSVPGPVDACRARFPSGLHRYLCRSYGRWYEVAQAGSSAGPGRHRFGGHADWLVGDGRVEANLAASGAYCGALSERGFGAAAQARGGLEAWRLLWQIDTDPLAGLRWSGGGRLYLLMRAGDLRTASFGRAWLVVQCR